MAGYTSGKFGLGLCDQCGQQFKLNELKKSGLGLKSVMSAINPNTRSLSLSVRSTNHRLC